MLEPLNPSINVSEPHIIADSNDLKLQKGRSGIFPVFASVPSFFSLVRYFAAASIGKFRKYVEKGKKKREIGFPSVNRVQSYDSRL